MVSARPSLSRQAPVGRLGTPAKSMPSTGYFSIRFMNYPDEMEDPPLRGRNELKKGVDRGRRKSPAGELADILERLDLVFPGRLQHLHVQPVDQVGQGDDAAPHRH